VLKKLLRKFDSPVTKKTSCAIDKYDFLRCCECFFSEFLIEFCFWEGRSYFSLNFPKFNMVTQEKEYVIFCVNIFLLQLRRIPKGRVKYCNT
jgi:hypothetical protein